MRISRFVPMLIAAAFVLCCFSPRSRGGEAPAPLSKDKAELIGRVEDFFLHNFRDVSWRKSLEWGDVQPAENGARSIRYTYEARIWDRETVTMSQLFTFAADGSFVSYKNVDGYPKPKDAKPADVTTQTGMKELVERFFSQNYRDITARQSLEWGPVVKEPNGNSSIRYKYLATIWGKEQKVIEDEFTFDPTGKFVSVKKLAVTAPATQKAGG